MAIISINKDIDLKPVDVDYAHQVNWQTAMTLADRQALEQDSIYGKWILTKFEWNNKEIHVASIYAPTCVTKPGTVGIGSHIARKGFWNFLSSKWTHHEHLIVGGDTNNIPDLAFDKRRLKPRISPEVIEDMQPYYNFLHSNDLVDTYLEQYDPSLGPVVMTHKSSKATSESRLDRWFHSTPLSDFAWIDLCTHASTNVPPPPFQTDHYPIELTLHMPDKSKMMAHGKIWRLNTALYKQKSHIDHVANILLEQYLHSIENGDAIRAFETFKRQSREYLKKQQDTRHKQLKQIREEAHRALQPNSIATPEEQNKAELDLKQANKYKLQGDFIRSKCDDISDASQMTKFHFMKIKIRNARDTVSELQDELGFTHTTQKSMEKVANTYWAKVMAKKVTDNDHLQTVMNKIDRVLPPESVAALNKHDKELISLDAIKDAILASALNKSPGIDGLPNEFYEALIEQHNGILLHLLQDVFVQSKRENKLPPTMRKIAMKLIYKYDHEEGKKYPKNYRPISLLSCDYKILSRILQASLGPHMKHLLDPDQFCAPNKEIGELILFLSANIDYCEHTKQQATLAFLDFAKAFDSVNHDFIFSIMKQMGIPESFIQWTKLGFIDTQASVILNGFLSEPFPLTGGGRQGDNLFPLLFTLVVQGLNALIKSSGATGVKCFNSQTFIKQYADDTTLFVGEDSDWAKYQRAIYIFCKASGMEINWDKSYALQLGAWNTMPPHNPSQHCHPDLKFIPDGQEERVLGVKLGTNIDPANAALQLTSKLERVLNSKLRHCGNQIGDTITVNSLVLSIPIYTMRLQFYPKHVCKEADKLAKKFIRGTGYLIRDSQRYATTRDGALVTLINMTRLAITLQAKWFYRILHATTLKETPIFTPFWLHYLPQILRKYNCMSLDHLIMSSTNFQAITLRPNNKIIPPFLHQCLLNYCTIGFTRKLTSTFEEYMNQPLFLNQNIINPQTLEPWTRNSFPNISLYKLYRVADLFMDFNIDRYTLDPEINSLQHPSVMAHLLNTKFARATRIPMITLDTWLTLIESIPDEWMDTVTQGNQGPPIPLEFYILPNYDFPHSLTKGDIYQYLHDGRLQYYSFPNPDTDGVIYKNGRPKHPGQRDRAHIYNDIPFPHLNTLRRITAYPINKDKTEYQIITHTLPDYKNSQTFNHNILLGQYTHIQYPNLPYSELAKKWRTSTSKIHPRTQVFLTHITNLGLAPTPDKGLTDIMKSIRNSLIPPKHKELLWKFINQGLYVGKVANEYQVNIKSVNPTNTPIITPPFCIYTHLAQNTVIEASYQWIFWESTQAQLIWKHVTQILLAIGRPLNIKSPYQIPLILIPNLSTTPTLLELTAQSIIILAMYTLYTAEYKLTRQYQTQQLNDIDKLRKWPRTVLSFFVEDLQTLIQLAPFLQYEINKRSQIPNKQGKLIRQHTLRKLAFTPKPYITTNNLTEEHIHIYNQFWCTRTALAVIKQNSLHFLHFHHYPP